MLNEQGCQFWTFLFLNEIRTKVGELEGGRDVFYKQSLDLLRVEALQAIGFIAF